MAQAGQANSLEEALAVDPEALGDDYMGKRVSATSVSIKKAGDGLSKQLAIAPRILVPGERYMVLVEGIAGDHTHKLIDKADSWELVQVLNADTVTFVDDKASESKIRKAKDRIAKHEEQVKGKERLPGTDAEDLEPKDDHDTDPGARPDPDWEEDEPSD